jgi:16S rRNA (cytosine1402-N4)-methyltransferase
MSDAYHIPVLLHESVSALNIDPAGIYVDVTFGGGGHSKEILKHLGPQGRLYAFDQDPAAATNAPKDERFLLIPWNYRYLYKMLRFVGVHGVNGILADLGVSSHQFDEASRGFSFRTDARLDMRMNTDSTFDAAELLSTYNETELQEMFSKNAELRNARQLALAIVAHRKQTPLLTTGDLMNIAETVMIGERHKYLAQVFQAIRIEVNDELHALADMLEDTKKILLPGARLVVISYHSLEDKLVKAALRDEEDDSVGNLTGQRQKNFRIISKKPVLPEKDEVKNNPRAASARMRIAEKQ